MSDAFRRIENKVFVDKRRIERGKPRHKVYVFTDHTVRRAAKCRRRWTGCALHKRINQFFHFGRCILMRGTSNDVSIKVIIIFFWFTFIVSCWIALICHDKCKTAVRQRDGSREVFRASSVKVIAIRSQNNSCHKSFIRYKTVGRSSQEIIVMVFECISNLRLVWNEVRKNFVLWRFSKAISSADDFIHQG